MKELEKLTFWQQCRFKGLYAICYLVSLQPLWMLYIFSDFLYFLVFYIVRYRRSIVHKNLLTSFPEKNEDELIDITHEFYHWFCDYLVETIKLTTISKEELCRRNILDAFALQELVQHGEAVVLGFGVLSTAPRRQTCHAASGALLQLGVGFFYSTAHQPTRNCMDAHANLPSFGKSCC